MQFSLFGADAAEPILADLDGVVLAGGDWVLDGAEAKARLSVLVADTWRAAELVGELHRRGLAPDRVTAPAGMIAVRTHFSELLVPRAAAWRRGAALRRPAEFELTASGLRFWAIVAGYRDEVSYLLASADRNPDLHKAGGAQLARLGIAGVEIASRPAPGWRITSAKRLRRFSELVGPAPPGANQNWPTG